VGAHPGGWGGVWGMRSALIERPIIPVIEWDRTIHSRLAAEWERWTTSSWGMHQQAVESLSRAGVPRKAAVKASSRAAVWEEWATSSPGRRRPRGPGGCTPWATWCLRPRTRARACDRADAMRRVCGAVSVGPARVAVSVRQVEQSAVRHTSRASNTVKAPEFISARQAPRLLPGVEHMYSRGPERVTMPLGLTFAVSCLGTLHPSTAYPTPVTHDHVKSQVPRSWAGLRQRQGLTRMPELPARAGAGSTAGARQTPPGPRTPCAASDPWLPSFAARGGGGASSVGDRVFVAWVLGPNL
jgi:hypothetical protein